MKTWILMLWSLVVIMQGTCQVEGDTIPLELDKDNGIQLSNNSIPTLENAGSSDVLVHVLEKLESLEKDNWRLRQDLESSESRLTGQVQALQDENAQFRQLLDDASLQMRRLTSDTAESVKDVLQTQSDDIARQISTLSTSLAELQNYQGTLADDNEVIVRMVMKLEDRIAILDQLETRVANVNDSLIEFQASGCGCSEELDGLRKILYLMQTYVLNTSNMPYGASTAPPYATSPPPGSTDSYTVDVWTTTPPEYTSTPSADLQFVVSASEIGERDVVVNSIVVTDNNQLVIADRIGGWLKLSKLNEPGRFLDSKQLHSDPWGLLQLSDGTIAATLEFANEIAVYNVSDDQLELVRTIHTEADYGGIAPGPDRDTLVVSKWKLDSHARLDVINMEGEIQRTLFEDRDLLIDPYCLRRYGEDVYVSDWTSQRFFSVNVYTGKVNTKMGNLDLLGLPISEPRSFDMDESGTVYLATLSSLCPNQYYCILRITQEGEVTAMEQFTRRLDGIYPYAVEVTPNEIIISWANWDSGAWQSELTSYALPTSSAELVTTRYPLRTGRAFYGASSSLEEHKTTWYPWWTGRASWRQTGRASYGTTSSPGEYKTSWYPWWQTGRASYGTTSSPGEYKTSWYPWLTGRASYGASSSSQEFGTTGSPYPYAMSTESMYGSTPPPGPLSDYAVYGGSLFTTILVTKTGKVLTADYNRQAVHMQSIADIKTVEDSLHIDFRPWQMAELDNDTVVVTSEDGPSIALLRLSDSGLQLVEEVNTLERRYRGVAVCGANGPLVVSSRQNDDDSSNRDARIDVLSREGHVMETLLDGGDNDDLKKPLFLTCRDQELFVSDWGSHKIFVLNTETRNVSSAFGNLDLTDLNLFQPRVVAFDREGRMYVTTGGRVCMDGYYFDEDETFCVLQVSPSGQWRQLEKYTSPVSGMFPYGIGIMGQQIVISWGYWDDGTWFAELALYDLPASTTDAPYFA